MVSESLIEELLPLAFVGTGKAEGEGKVREWWRLAGGRRFIETTDRLSAFDRVLAAVPFKGQVLNELSVFWFLDSPQTSSRTTSVSVPDPNCAVVREASPLPHSK